MHEHEFKFDRQSMINIRGIDILVDVYKCQICNGIRILNTETRETITLNGAMGEEI